MSKTPYIVLFLVLLLVLILGWYFLSSGVNSGFYNDFASCLTQKGTVMYGANSCPHCQNQKALFSGSFKYINYVECTQEPQKCIQAGIEAFPTWILANGKRLVGEQSLETLSKETSCPLSYQAFKTLKQ